jgi:hypothetical protein
MTVQHYRIHGVTVQITAPSGALADAVAALLTPFAVAGNHTPVCRFMIRHGEPPTVDDGLMLVERTVLPGGREIRHFADAHRRISHVAGLAWHRLDLHHRQGEIVVRPGEEWCLESGSLTPMLCDVLAQEQHHVFHAATLVAQTKAGPRAIILAGVSGAGKTTTALALAHAGLTLLADDATFLVRRNGALKVCGFPRPCKVHRRTLAMLDWLRELEPNPLWRHDEFLLALQRVSPADPDCEVFPGLLVLLQSRNDQAHRFEEWNRLEAMTEMTRQNVRAVRGMALQSAGGCFAVVGDLVTGSRTLRLSIGPDLTSLAAELCRELEN